MTMSFLRLVVSSLAPKKETQARAQMSWETLETHLVLLTMTWRTQVVKRNLGCEKWVKLTSLCHAFLLSLFIPNIPVLAEPYQVIPRLLKTIYTSCFLSLSTQIYLAHVCVFTTFWNFRNSEQSQILLVGIGSPHPCVLALTSFSNLSPNFRHKPPVQMNGSVLIALSPGTLFFPHLYLQMQFSINFT
jgi:hypothetical protein